MAISRIILAYKYARDWTLSNILNVIEPKLKRRLVQRELQKGMASKIEEK
jgi:hypothetical protein